MAYITTVPVFLGENPVAKRMRLAYKGNRRGALRLLERALRIVYQQDGRERVKAQALGVLPQLFFGEQNDPVEQARLTIFTALQTAFSKRV